ncbi:DegQ family serine endoprotease [Magnetospira sp. QH-2]|uniref:DegQ family serine endoprotease n=1 Tax=Magnetospira sp. (strain QH-2) TaxID=1288970 RepID=UPI0003E815C7|nr:DegQ family serine endoprotease [Magnetospira sp. QH-2]CCQ73485.1 Serine endoprotease (protease Do), membrane-associated [Magnetospira sp. QH-2]
MSQRKIARVLTSARDSLPEDRMVRWMIAGLLATAMLVAAAAAQARGAPDSFADLAEKLLPSVVNISTTQVVQGQPGIEMPQFPPGSPFEDFFKHFFDQQGEGNGMGREPRKRRATSLGSGFFINEGYVVTNNHVIEGADKIFVILQDDTRLEADLVGRDPKTDVAVLKLVDEKKVDIAPLELGDSNKVRVGDWILAIGNPFGLGGTVTAGIVSAQGRDINAGPYDEFIQTDASINKGNSGGPMFNLNGEVIGINTAIYSPSGGSVGIGFAQPMAVVKPVINQLIKYGRTKRGWLGVRIQHVTEEIAESLGLKETKGALVAGVMEDGPAAPAGIKSGDVIITFNGREVTEMRRLPRIVAETEIDAEVPVQVWRNGEVVDLKVVIGELEESEVAEATPAKSKANGTSGAVGIDSLGLTVARASDSVRNRFSLGEGEIKGVVVTDVDQEGPAAEKGVQEGDIIVEVNQYEIGAPKDVIQRIEEARKGKRRSVLLFVERQGDLRIVGVRLREG